ncbi:Apurinic endonuclease-redox [Hyphodiscus hymeniophilus]|uniref:Apurinic endonuclease-redox n=1 Tax=Hyphodiscus hymeniophilus TaxID=353542 RepID=A0A9P6VIX7_9HELO|nr:Apurinic endonuclease-redox [Hyphodiscus hymeniophilus]
MSFLDEKMAEVDERFQIFSWNVNGVSQFLDFDTPKITSYFTSPSSSSVLTANDTSGGHNPLRKFLERHSWPEMLCLQEVKISPKDLATKRALEKAANDPGKRDGGPAYTAHFSLPTDRYNATGFGRKVHGVCTLIKTSLLPSSLIKEVNWDLEGRVLITEFSKWKLAVVNGYWVNGTSNPYHSSETGVVNGTRHDRKRHFHSLMLAEAKSYETKGWHVVLIGDMNIAPSLIDGHPNLRGGFEHVRNRKDFNEKFLSRNKDGMNGIDTFRYFHGGLRKYTYHGESAERWGENCDRVDLGIVSRSLVEKVRGALVGAEIWDSVEERGRSDHVPLSIILDVGRLEGADETYS